MAGTEIIQFIANNVSTFFSPVNIIAGSLFTAIFLRKNTATQEFEKLKAGKFQEVADELLESGKMTYTEYYKANNFLNVAKKADAFYVQMNHENEKNCQHDLDWFMRFYEIVGNISDEKVQDMWARIMAGEISNPHSYSLSTIDVLKNIGKQEAELFSDVLSYCIVNGCDILLPNYDTYLERCGINYSQVMRLSELGLIYNDATIVLNTPISQEEKILFLNGNYIITIRSQKAHITNAKIKQFPLTTVGKELASLVEGSVSDSDFIAFAKTLAEDKNVEIQVHEIVKLEGNSVEYKMENIIA